MDIMYEVPSRDDIEKVVITKESITDNKQPYVILKSNKKDDTPEETA
jgi:ATP-dependent Clp protease ATP-binding subunit ClpX (EC 3.4.21.92)